MDTKLNRPINYDQFGLMSVKKIMWQTGLDLKSLKTNHLAIPQKVNGILVCFS